MERTLLSMGEEWSPFQKLPTNALQLVMDYTALSYSLQYSNRTRIEEIIKEHQQLIRAAEGGLSLDMIYEMVGMVSERTIIT